VTLNIAVNNPDMIELQKLAPQFEKANPDIKLRWVTMEERAAPAPDHRYRHQQRPVRPDDHRCL
jgi:hypothetical protein